jgi:hypothetical protein
MRLRIQFESPAFDVQPKHARYTYLMVGLVPNFDIEGFRAGMLDDQGPVCLSKTPNVVAGSLRVQGRQNVQST